MTSIFGKRVEGATKPPPLSVSKHKTVDEKQWWETLRDTITGRVQEAEEYIAGNVFRCNEKLDDVLTILRRPPEMHPETCILRQEARDQIKFLQELVTTLSIKPTPVTPAPVIVGHKKDADEFDPEDFTEKQLIECAKLLSDATLLGIVRDRKNTTTSSNGARTVPLPKR